MKPAHRRLVNLVKLAAVAALILYVASNVQWRDTLTVRGADGTVAREAQGAIRGSWEGDTVRFAARQADGTLAAEDDVRTGPRPDGTQVYVSPGFLTYLRNLDVGLFLLAALCTLFTMTVAATRWWWLLRVNRLAVGFWEAQRFTWIGMFFNNLVPGGTGGDLIKAVYIMKHCPGGRVPALVSVIVDRVMGLGSLAVLAAVVVLFHLDRFGRLAIAIWAVVLGVCLLGVVAFSRRLRDWTGLKWLLARLPASLQSPLQRIDQAVFFYRGHTAGMALWTLIGIGNHVVSVACVLILGEALNVGLPAADYFVLIPIANIVTAVPIAPNGWGVGEFLYRYLFGTYGAVHLTAVVDPVRVMGTRGVALSVLYRIQVTLLSFLGGLLVLLEKDRVSAKDLAAEAEIEAAEARGGDAGRDSTPPVR